ncbi:hypothetical protein CDD83_7906 [Cordyceps sp. RAO-2017]|nr:hypothetical protein CDD83_7906 [Cordyceps sp. RAO-2017]
MASMLFSSSNLFSDPPWRAIAALAVTCTTFAATVHVLGQSCCCRTSRARTGRRQLQLRIDGIPIDRSIEDVQNIITSLVRGDKVLEEAVATPVVYSLAPTHACIAYAIVCVSASIRDEEVAFRLRQAAGASSYLFSSAFHGITPLYQDGDSAHVDFIAVPGLSSHALGSWKSHTNNEVWLRDYLRDDISGIRVLLYGYDTQLRDSDSKQSIENLGNALLECITSFRANDGTSRRPIIFLGHSLGGLLVKDAIVSARRIWANDPKVDLCLLCYSMLFFGVPHLGLRIIQGQPNQALIHDLVIDNHEEPSTFLKRLSDQFSQSCKGQYPVVNFFFKRRFSPTIQGLPDGSLRKTGEKKLLISEKSATSTGLVAAADQDTVPFHTDHSGLVKFDSRGQVEYRIVRERLRRLAAMAAANMDRCGAQQNSGQLGLNEREDEALRSLAFPEMNNRIQDIDPAAEGTCRWLLKHETFINSLLNIGVYFGSKATRAQANRRYSSDLMDEFEENGNRYGSQGKNWQSHPNQLWAFLESSIPRILENRSLVLFVDALDEAGEKTVIELVQSFKRLCNSLRPTPFRLQSASRADTSPSRTLTPSGR